MIVDKEYCMSSYLMYRTICDDDRTFFENTKPNLYSKEYPVDSITNSFELEESLRRSVEAATKDGKTALALSAGIDSAILAKFMPKGSTVYTFKCIVPGMQVVDESIQAAKYAKECGLVHKIVEIYWEDFEAFTPKLVRHKMAPCHSIEVQIYKAALQAKKDGFERIIFGESADIKYGGMSGLLSKDWIFGEFVERYAYVKPWFALKKPVHILDPIARHTYNGVVDVHEFVNDVFYREAMGSYQNACETADIDLIVPYRYTNMDCPIDLERIRRGENKYLVREVFNRLYPDYETPVKTPMPHPMNEWFSDWEGPKREEFWPNCVKGMTGDQKWMLYALECYLNVMEGKA